MRVRSNRVAAVAAVLALVLTACGGSKSNASPTTTPTNATTIATTAAANGGPNTPAQPSRGCGGSIAKPGESTGTMTVNGVERTYFLHVPPAHDGSTPLPVVLDFHGYTEGAAIQRALSRFESYGDTHGFVTVTPQGAGKVPKWIFNADGSITDLSTKNPDAVFISDLLDRVEKELCVDEARVYATGLSNGGMMTSWLACVMSDRIAAAAPVAGLVTLTPCDATRPVPMMAIHGTKDPFLPYNGGVGSSAKLLKNDYGQPLVGANGTTDTTTSVGGSTLDLINSTVPERATAWAKRNGCKDAAPQKERVTEHVTLSTWDCPPGADVELYTVEGGGHAWPGSKFSQSIASFVGFTTMEVDADELIWDFFQQHALPAHS